MTDSRYSSFSHEYLTGQLGSILYETVITAVKKKIGDFMFLPHVQINIIDP